MQSIQDLLKKTSSPDSPQSKSPCTNNTPTTESTTAEPFDYWAWYNRPDNSIRQWDEAHGLRQITNEMYTYVGIDRDAFESANPAASVYPEYFKLRTFDRFNPLLYGADRAKAEKALDMAKRYADGIDAIMAEYDGAGLYFYSKTKGSGKTFLSTILGNELTRRGKRVRWYGVTNLLQDIKASYDRESGTSSAEIISLCKTAEILILDDIGVEKQSSWVNETMYTILDERLTHARPTIFTSNIRPLELQYDARVTDRISRMTELIEMPEENVRQRLNAKSGVGAFLGK